MARRKATFVNIKDIDLEEENKEVDKTTIVKEFMEKLSTIEGEIQLLNEDKKVLVEDYKDKIDMKALKAAIRIVRIKAKLGPSESECETYMCEIDGRV
jgi:uncharacterized protein (UPF0335 family)